MKTRIMQIGIALALVCSGYFLGRGIPAVQAQADESIPMAWGTINQVTPTQIIMQDQNATERFLDIKTLKVVRTIKRD